jgi:hypothetical protein
VPVPGDVSAAFRSLAEAFDFMRHEHDIGGGDTGAGDEQQQHPHHDPALIDQMIETLLQGADMPPREVEGVNEEFCDSE